MLLLRIWAPDWTPCNRLQVDRLSATVDRLQGLQNKLVLLDGEMAEWLKAAVC